MAPESPVLRRTRSRPSQWWAANPTNPSSVPLQSYSKAPSKDRNEPTTTSVPEPRSLKRKRSRPSDWWAANPLASTSKQDEMLPEGRDYQPENSGVSVAQDTHGTLDKGPGGKRNVELRGKGVTNEDNDARGSANLLAKVQLSKSTAELSKAAGRAKRVGGPAAQDKSALDDEVVFKKRERPAKTEHGKKLAEMSGALRRGRSSLNGPGSETVVTAPSQDKTPRRQGGHRFGVAAQIGVKPDGPAVTTHGKALQKRRKRISDAERLEREAAFLLSGHGRENGRSRTRQSTDDAILSIPPAASELKGQKVAKRRTQQLRDGPIEVEVASSAFGRNPTAKRGRPALIPEAESVVGQNSRKTKSKVRSPETNIPKANRKLSNMSSRIEPRPKMRKVEHQEPEPAKRHRGISKDRNMTLEPEQDSEELPAYRHIAAVSRRVPRHTIEGKWEALPPNCVNRISQMVQDMQIPVISRLSDERKKTQSSSVLKTFSLRIAKRLSKGIPFPQGSRSRREDDFDFEKILDHTRALESQLTPALHANELLESELRKEEARLEVEKENLAHLEANAKTESIVRGRAARKEHSLLQSDEAAAKTELLMKDIGLDIEIIAPQISVTSDENLDALAKDMEGHVASIQGNIKQVEGISKAMEESRAAVQATLFDHLDSTQYKDLLLGLE